jgi:cytochrome c-type biogenesis protein CcmH
MAAGARRAGAEGEVVTRAVAILALAALLAAGPGADLAAAAACPKTSLADIEDEVMCPVCGVPLELATEAPQANRERAFIQRQVQACQSKQQIKNELVAQFGDRVLALPPSKGFNLVAYLAPAAAVLAGIAAVVTLARRRRRGAATSSDATNGTGPVTPALAGEDAARLEADIQSYDL